MQDDSSFTKKSFTIALAGNPNSGKTTTFNNLTGARQKVGNWPGVTVEKKEGRATFRGMEVTVVDLPGTYSLTAFSIEEVVARNYILDTRPDLVVDVIDASNLERSLYLATQLRELSVPVLFVLNMMDVAKSRGTVIDEKKLSELLAVPVVTTVGNRNQGTESLLSAIMEAAGRHETIPESRRVKYSRDLEASIQVIRDMLRRITSCSFPLGFRWTAIKLLENDTVVRERTAALLGPEAGPVMEETERQRARLAQLYDEEPEIVMTEERYGYIAGIVAEVVRSKSAARVDVSRKIDLVLTNRYLGFPIFLFFIWAMFQLTFTLGAYPQAAIEAGVSALSAFLSSALPSGFGTGLLVDGVISGVGSVLAFFPNILILFLCISLFEDTGYMARAAFLMDRIMHLMGLHGKSFIPLLMGFGCNVPAIMAARTLENEKDRILTILINPLMSCSARLPVYVLLAGAFFPRFAGDVIFSIYLLGIVLSFVMGRLFRKAILPGEAAPFVMELPPYRAPMARSLLIHMWDRSRMFLKKMGSVILVGSIVIWALSSFPRTQETLRAEALQARVREARIALANAPGSEAAREAFVKAAEAQRESEAKAKAESYLGRTGKAIAPAFAPIGLAWSEAVALVTGFVAKEVVVSTMAVLHAAGTEDENGLAEALSASGMTPLSALAMMVFVLLYVPCLATVATIRQETNSWKWAAFSICYSTALAWIAAFVVFQGGRLLGLG
ncbi:MAG: ferrous iron transport protein B [Thermodesulfobacteriota bacterium]